MPLKSGKSQATISENIRELHHGPTHERTAKKFGEERAHEQSIAIAMETARKTKRKKGGRVHLGPVIGNTGGRADKVNASVPDGCYVIPSQAVSHLGENNTMAGMKVLQKMFPHSSPKEAKKTSDSVPVAIADGEFCVSVPDVERVGGGDLDHGHRVLDAWVNQLKEDHIRTLKGLEAPAKD